jgi:hypothetical protein
MKHCDAAATPRDARDAHDGNETRSERYINMNISYEYYEHTW